MVIVPKNLSSAAALKLRRAQEASKAMQEYETERSVIRVKTERLRAERLAREAIAPAPKKAGKRKPQLEK